MNRRSLLLLVFAGLPLAHGQAPSSEAAFASRDTRYRLQLSDVIEVHYRYTPEFDQTVTVQPDGFVALKIVGDVKLQGLTIDEAKDSIEKKAAVRLRDPEVTLILKEFEKPYLTVSGEVASPGRLEMRGRTSALEAIALAGGFRTGSARHSQVILFRRVDTDLARTQILNLKDALDGKSQEPNIELAPGDMLYVPQNRVSKIERFVKWGNFGAIWNQIPR